MVDTRKGMMQTTIGGLCVSADASEVCARQYGVCPESVLVVVQKPRVDGVASQHRLQCKVHT